MKSRDTNKAERRFAFRGWRRHIGAAERIHFEESRKKITIREEPLSSPPISPPPDPSR